MANFLTHYREMIKVDNKTAYVVRAFRAGNDTVAIADSLHEKEHVIERMLHAGLAIERHRQQSADGEKNERCP